MPSTAANFLLGLAVGTGLLALGLLLGFWFGRKSAPTSDFVDRQRFLAFMRNLTNWTSEYSGDVADYQSQLSNIRDQVALKDSVSSREQILALLSEIMRTNKNLQNRLESAEQRLESQTDQISNYLTEARTDGLTGLFNRRAFDQAIDELFDDWIKQQQAFTLVLIDIDHFKPINDTFGHPAGDAVLQQIAGRLQADLTEAICVARYGGEEFAVLSTLLADQAAKVIDALREAISRLVITHEEHDISITLSGGVAQVRGDDDIGKLIRRADEALYSAKLGGRNRIYLHDGTLCHLVTQGAEPPSSAAGSPSEHNKRADQQIQQRLQARLQRIVEEESRRLIGR